MTRHPSTFLDDTSLYAHDPGHVFLTPSTPSLINTHTHIHTHTLTRTHTHTHTHLDTSFLPRPPHLPILPSLARSLPRTHVIDIYSSNCKSGI